VRTISRHSLASTAASQVTTPSMVAMLGWIMPDPLAHPPIVISTPPDQSPRGRGGGQINVPCGHRAPWDPQKIPQISQPFSYFSYRQVSKPDIQTRGGVGSLHIVNQNKRQRRFVYVSFRFVFVFVSSFSSFRFRFVSPGTKISGNVVSFTSRFILFYRISYFILLYLML
jgi:hypothetical protein